MLYGMPKVKGANKHKIRQEDIPAAKRMMEESVIYVQGSTL